jgi:hypothetical protein
MQAKQTMTHKSFGAILIKVISERGVAVFENSAKLNGILHLMMLKLNDKTVIASYRRFKTAP